MKSIALAAALSLAATIAFAGSLAEPVVEPAIEAPADGSSASLNGSGIIIPVLVLLAIGAAVVASND